VYRRTVGAGDRFGISGRESIVIRFVGSLRILYTLNTIKPLQTGKPTPALRWHLIFITPLVFDFTLTTTERSKSVVGALPLLKTVPVLP
jgi:hypothetical protein